MKPPFVGNVSQNFEYYSFFLQEEIKRPLVNMFVSMFWKCLIENFYKLEKFYSLKVPIKRFTGSFYLQMSNSLYVVASAL